MTDNYDRESEHSAMAEELTTEADTSLHTKTEVPILLLDTSSQASATETEASTESNPISTLLAAAAHNSCCSSPMADFSQLQSHVHLAVNSMFTTRRSSDLEIQCTIQDFEVSLYQREVETAALMKRPRLPIQGGT